MRKERIYIYLILLGIILNILFGNIELEGKTNNNDNIKILFTHDMHDHLENYDVLEEGIEKNIGGYSRLSTIVKKEKSKDKDILLLDAGDYSMGTLFQTIYVEESPSLRLMGKIGYDVTTLGNHEFDFRAIGLAESLLSAKRKGENLPKIVFSNIDFKTNINEENKEDVKILEESFNEYEIEEYTILERKNKKIGIFGVLGDEAISNAPMSQVNFKDYIESSIKVVEKLKEEQVDMIICLSHAGTSRNLDKSEDHILAKEVPEIDLIISGHSHTTYEVEEKVGNTTIVSAGPYTKNLGIIELEEDLDSWDVINYELIELDDSIEKDENILLEIEEYKKIVQKNYLDKFNLEFNQTLAYSPFHFTESRKIGKTHGEDTLANLITDSYIYMIKDLEGDDYEEITASIVPAGTIRDSFTKGNITVSDVFNVSSLGIGADKISGYPLISVYLTGEDLKMATEVDASIGSMMSVAQLYMSGVNYTLNPNRIIFNKITDVYISKDGVRKEIKDDELYRVVAGLYTGQMLSIVSEESFGLISIVPRDKEGNPIEDFEDYIIHNNKGEEIKEWYALAHYIKSFDGNKVSEIPDKYNKMEGRKIIDNDNSIMAKLKNPNKIILKLLVIIIFFIIMIISLIYFIFKRIKGSSRED